MSKTGKSTGTFLRGASLLNAKHAETNRGYAGKAAKVSTGIYKRGIENDIERTGSPNVLPPRYRKIT